jgi:hypothetical protein
VPFLEHTIHERKDTSPDFHNELISNYLDTVRALRGDFTGRGRSGTNSEVRNFSENSWKILGKLLHDFGDVGENSMKFRRIGELNLTGRVARHHQKKTCRLPGKFTILHCRQNAHEISPRRCVVVQYHLHFFSENSERVVVDLFEERAILLKKIGQHEKALFIYAHELKDYRLAEE